MYQLDFDKNRTVKVIFFITKTSLWPNVTDIGDNLLIIKFLISLKEVIFFKIQLKFL